MEERCLKCHNDPKLYELEDYRKTDWKVGDIRGVLEVVCPLEDNTIQTQQTLYNTYLEVAGAGPPCWRSPGPASCWDGGDAASDPRSCEGIHSR